MTVKRPWTTRFSLSPVCPIAEHREANSEILTAIEKLVSHRKPTDENFRKTILPHIIWKTGPENCEEDGIILWLGARLVEDEISWISGGSYMEGPGKLLGDLIDSKDDGGSVSWKVSIWVAVGK